MVAAKSAKHKFFDHGDFDPADYNLFDTFEPYTWHKYEHSAAQAASSTSKNFREFYLGKQAEKEFA